jgi:uncharacterized membrane protein
MVVSTNYELHRDAYLYLAESDHLAWGYLSIPPLTPFFAHCWQILFGSSVLAIRMIPAVIGVLCIILISKIVRELGGGTWSIILACLAYLVSPAFLRSNTLFQPVTFDIFFWTLGTWAMIRLLRSEDRRWWLVLGIIFGFGFLNKYSIVFPALSFVLALSFTKQRFLFFSRWLFWGALAALIIILPNLLWQYNHNWPVVHHMTQLENGQLTHVKLSDFLVMQLFMILPAIPLFFAGLFYGLFDKSTNKLRAMGWTYIVLLILLISLSGKPYYTLGIYPVFFAFGAVAIVRFTEDAFKWIRPALAGLMILILLPILPMSLPVLSYPDMIRYDQAISKWGMKDVLRWEDGSIHPLPQDYADMTGWHELAEVIDSTWHTISPNEQKTTRIYAENYGQAGAIHYYNKKKQMPEPISFSDSFLFWAPDSIAGTTLIYVNNETAGIRKLYKEITLAGKITNPYAREHGMQVYLCRKPFNSFTKFYADKVDSLKAEYQAFGVQQSNVNSQ